MKKSKQRKPWTETRQWVLAERKYEQVQAAYHKAVEEFWCNVPYLLEFVASARLSKNLNVTFTNGRREQIKVPGAQYDYRRTIEKGGCVSNRTEYEQWLSSMTRKKAEEGFQENVVFTIPILRDLYGKRKDLRILELGPSYESFVPEALEDNLAIYAAVDLEETALQKQREFLAARKSLSKRVLLLSTDSHQLQFVKDSFDLIVTNCHPPLVSATITQQCRLLETLYDCLAPGGELVIHPIRFEKKNPRIVKTMLRLFEIKAIAHRLNDSTRKLLVLKKR